jgi:hypothetical protein
MAGVPRSYEYMFVAYAWAELYREMRINPPSLERIGYSGATSLYRDGFNRISKIHDSYTEVHGKEKAERTYLRSIKITSQEFWAGKVDLPLGMKHPSNLENNWGHQHDQIYDEWSVKSDEERIENLQAILNEDKETQDLQSVLIQKPNFGLRSVMIRRGQPKFRKKLLSLYDSCMITGCRIKGVLEACHIVPYSVNHDNSPENGLLLRSDLHTMLDCGLLSISAEGIVHFSHEEIPSHYDIFDGHQIDFAGILDRSKIVQNIRTYISLNQN